MLSVSSVLMIWMYILSYKLGKYEYFALYVHEEDKF